MQREFIHKLFLIMLCTTQLPVNIISMRRTNPYQNCLTIIEDAQCELIPEIQGKIVTTILDLYLNEYENMINIAKLNGNNYIFGNQVLNKILYWIERTRFNPLQETINLNTTNSDGHTILHYATYATLEHQSDINMFNLTRYLLEHKADPNIHNNYKKTAFHVCMATINTFYSGKSINDKQAKVIKLFLTYADPNISAQNTNFLCTLAEIPYSESIKQILERIDLKKFMELKDDTNDYSTTLAHFVVACSNLEFLRVLIKVDADLTLKDSNGLTPLEFSLNYMNLDPSDEIIKLLQEATQVRNK